jgi:hypothetical protein
MSGMHDAMLRDMNDFLNALRLVDEGLAEELEDILRSYDMLES